jgi:hypothetical protein
VASTPSALSQHRSPAHPRNMSNLATIEQSPAIADTKPARQPRIPPKISQIVDWLVTGACKNQQAACDRAGLDPSYVSRELRKVHVRVFAERRARETIANGTMRATARLMELIDASSEHVSADVTKHVLAIAGIKPTADAQVSVNIDIKAGYVIDLTDAPRPPAITIEHE